MRDEFFEELSERLCGIIGKLSVPAMMGGLQQLVKECHKELIELAEWVDDEIHREEESK